MYAKTANERRTRATHHGRRRRIGKVINCIIKYPSLVTMRVYFNNIIAVGTAKIVGCAAMLFSTNADTDSDANADDTDVRGEICGTHS